MNARQTDNFYSVLGVSENASLADIKTAFTKIIKEVHPDKVSLTALVDIDE